ncbi:MAG: BrnA antitoxin family protein [Paracoccus sp. (in: a-proteobacteria)]|nr:BrnA antitoxin family protein [Paracoccus sp. (in: a-proteobacteria)]
MAITKAAEARRRNYHYMADAMRRLEWDLHQTIFARMRIPPEWHEVAREKGQSKTTRVTIRLDEELVKFFRATGTDWQPRVNRVLSAWVHARLAGLIEGAETMDYMKRSDNDEVDYDGPRPEWADTPRALEREGLSEDFAWGGMPGEKGVPMGEEDGRYPLGEPMAVRAARIRAEMLRERG